MHSGGFGGVGLRNRRMLETHSRSLEEPPFYRDDGSSVHDNLSLQDSQLDSWADHRSWCAPPLAAPPTESDWSTVAVGGQYHPPAGPGQPPPSYGPHPPPAGPGQPPPYGPGVGPHGHHRRLPQTPRRPSTLLNMPVAGPGQPGQQTSVLNQQNIQQHNLQNQQHKFPPSLAPPPSLNQKSTQSSGSIFDKVSNFKQNLLPNLSGGSLPAGTPLSFGVNSTLTVKSERNERDQFTRSGPNPNFVSSLLNNVAQQNGTYSSHPNLQTQSKQQSTTTTTTTTKQHRQLPAVPKQPSSLKLSSWRQSSLPEKWNPPGQEADTVPVIPPHPHHRRIKPITPTKPSTLSLRQSTSHMNGSAPSQNYNLLFPVYQMPKLNCSPSSTGNGITDTMVHFNGNVQHRTLPPVIDRRNALNLGRSLPLPPPPPPAPSSPSPAAPSHKQNGSYNGLSGIFHRNSQEVDWI